MEQVNYLIDENDFPGKGANSVVSMVHHYLDSKLPTCPHLLIHADNAVGQNKNNIVLDYLAWRVSTGRNRSIKLSFMLPGHTKFAPDRFFGQVKKLYRRTSVSTLYEIEEVVRNSIIGGRNIPQVTVNSRTGERYVTWYDWSEHMKKFFRPFPGISNYHHFRLDVSEPGTVFAKEYNDSEEIQYTIALSDNFPDSMQELPTEITPPGMSVDRRQYLFDNIRQFCATAEAAELTCPAISHPSKRKKKGDLPPSKRKKTSQRKCSHCHEPGHTKTIRGKVTCPKLL